MGQTRGHDMPRNSGANSAVSGTHWHELEAFGRVRHRQTRGPITQARASADRHIASGDSKLDYAPTNSCDATTTEFDKNADHRLSPGEGAGTTNGLDQPAGGNTVQQELTARGFQTPTLF